jgi:hypothetical protein
MNISTINEMIKCLIDAKNKYGGDSAIAIKDIDTGWHMKISGIRESNNVNNRVLICGAGYDNDDLLDR